MRQNEEPPLSGQSLCVARFKVPIGIAVHDRDVQFVQIYRGVDATLRQARQEDMNRTVVFEQLPRQQASSGRWGETRPAHRHRTSSSASNKKRPDFAFYYGRITSLTHRLHHCQTAMPICPSERRLRVNRSFPAPNFSPQLGEKCLAINRSARTLTPSV